MNDNTHLINDNPAKISTCRCCCSQTFLAAFLVEYFRSYMKYYVIQLYIYWLWHWTLHNDNSNTMMPVFVYWIWIYAFLFRSTLNRKLNSELVCLAPLGPQVNKLYCTRSRTRFHNHGLCKMLQIKCHVNINRMISVVCCIGVPMVYALTSKPVSYPDWLEINIECRLLNMQIMVMSD